MEIKLTEQDVKYLNAILDDQRLVQIRIASLEIEKLKQANKYIELEKLWDNFSVQIKQKYEITDDDAEVDLDKGVIIVKDQKESESTFHREDDPDFKDE